MALLEFLILRKPRSGCLEGRTALIQPIVNFITASFRGGDGRRDDVICLVGTTLMSAFPSSRRVNSWLHWKQQVQALPGRAGGAAVEATVDHTLMRGSKPHDR